MPSQQLTFRHEDIEQLCSIIKAGESASIIGVSGTGKSNLFNHLLDGATREHYLGSQWQNYVFVRVNFHYLADLSMRSVYSLILDALEQIEDIEAENGQTQSASTIHNYHDALIDAGHNVLKVQHSFKRAVRSLMSGNKRHLVFLFDQFEELYAKGDGRIFLNFRGLREEFKYRVSYLVFTRNSLPLLADTDAAREEFAELLAANLLGLKPYVRRDAGQMLARISKRLNIEVTPELAEALFELSGGHGGIYRAALLAHHNDALPLTVEALAQHRNIQTECEKLWNSLTINEQILVNQLANGIDSATMDRSVQQMLDRKGVVINDAVFSTLFNIYAQKQTNAVLQPIRYDRLTRRIYVNNSPAKRLTPLELRLFMCLYDSADEVVSQLELLQAGWPEHQLNQADSDLLTQRIKNLRKKIEPTPSTPKFIETIRGQGYRLNSQPE